MKSVFISSTQRDLSDYRDAVKAAIERLDLRAIDMRNFGSQPGGAVNTSVREVRKGDIYVGILAQRYGYVPEGMTKSVTEQEYDEAVRLGLPRLMYLLDDHFAWDAERIESDPTAQAKLQAFKDRVSANEVRSLFTTPDDLAKQVTADLVKLLDKGRRQTLITRGLAAVLTVIVLIALVLIADTGIRDQALKIVGIASPTSTSTATSTPTSTPTMTPSPTNTLTPTATPIEGTPFASDVIGVILADFKNDEPGVNNLGDPLALAFQQQNIPYVRVHHVLADRAEAQQLARLYSATLVVWGEKYSTGVQVNYEVDPTRSKTTTTVNNLLIAVDPDFSAFVINQGMGVPYLLDFTQGQMLYFEGNYTQALAALNAAVQRIPTGQEAELQAASLFRYRGMTYDGLGRPDDALADYNDALQLDPDNAYVYNDRGLIYIDQKKYDLALADYNTALQLNPDLAEAYLNRATFYQTQAKYDAALDDYNRGMQLKPNDSDAYSNLGSLYDDQGKYDLALTNLNRALEIKPDNEKAYVNRGVVYYHLARYEDALSDFNDALQLDPDDATAYSNRGLVYKTQGEYDLAMADFNRAIQLKPDDTVYLNRGIAYFDQDKNDLALDDLNKAIQFNPNNVSIYIVRGAVYTVESNFKRALEDFNYALQINPDLANAFAVRAVVYYRLGNYTQALADFQNYQQLTGKQAPHSQPIIEAMQAALTATVVALTATPPPLGELMS